MAGANVHDTKLLKPTLESIVVDRPEGVQNLCLDKGYDNPTGHRTVAEAAGWSGADLSAIWKEAALLAVSDKRKSICTEDYIGGFERVSRQRDKAQKG